MTSSPTVAPGYTDAEKQLLQSMLDELYSFIMATDWDQRLPVAIHRSYTLEQLGNPVQLTLKLYQHSRKNLNQEEINLLLDINIQGTGTERWKAADGGFFLSHGSANQVEADLRSFHADIRPVQAKLANEYRGTLYNS